MTTLLQSLAQLRRPKLLIRAARIGAGEYRRTTHLRNFLGLDRLPRSAVILKQLIEMEEALNQQRLEQLAGYSASKHVELLIAMMGEARLLRVQQPDCPV